MAPMNFEGRVCLITGAAGGIGKAAALMLAARGAMLAATDLREDGWQTELAAACGPRRPVALAADLTRHEEIDRVVDAAIDGFGRIDVLVNCAGIASLTRLGEVTRQEWDRVFAVNLTATFFLSQRVIGLMVARRNGTIVSVASASAKIGGVAVGPHYSASKAGIICLTKSLALYGAPHGVTANCVCPGPTATPMTDAWGEKLNAEFAARIPLKRYGSPNEVAEVICFLASSGASFMSGATVDVNGGLVMD